MSVDEITSLSGIGVTTVLLLATILGSVKLRVIHLAVLQSGLLIYSVHALDGRWQTSARLASMVILLIVGFYAARSLSVLRPLSTASKRGVSAKDGAEPALRVAPAITVFVASICVYHFARAGVPLFASNVEAARFEYANSGLFGLPSRMYLYGTFIAFSFAVGEARSGGSAITRDLWVRLSFGVFLMTRIISGFKSGLFEIATSALLVAILSSDGIQIRRYLGRILLTAAASIAFLFAVGSTYGSYASSGRSLSESIARRLTTQSAGPVWVVLNATGTGLGDNRKPVAMDVAYFEYRYFGVGHFQAYGFTRLVAAEVAGSNPESSLLIAPVTLSAYAFFSYQLGALCYIAVFMLGGAIGLVERRVANIRGSPFAFAGGCSLTNMLIAFVGRGEVIYLIVNWGLSVLAVFIVAWLVRLVTARPTRPRESVNSSLGSQFKGRSAVDR